MSFLSHIIGALRRVIILKKLFEEQWEELVVFGLPQWKDTQVMKRLCDLNAKLLRSICSAKDTQSIYCSRTNSFQFPNNCLLHHINYYSNKKDLTVQCEIFVNCTKSWIRLFMVSLYRRRRWWRAKQQLQSSRIEDAGKLFLLRWDTAALCLLPLKVKKNLNLISEFLSDFSVNFSQDAATKLSGHQEESNEKTKRWQLKRDNRKLRERN